MHIHIIGCPENLVKTISCILELVGIKLNVINLYDYNQKFWLVLSFIFLILLTLLIIIIAMWYATEIGKVRSIPLPFCVWTNRPQRLTAKRERWTKVNSSQPVDQSNESRSEWRSKATRTPWRIIGWTKKGMQVTLVAWLV